MRRVCRYSSWAPIQQVGSCTREKGAVGAGARETTGAGSRSVDSPTAAPVRLVSTFAGRQTYTRQYHTADHIIISLLNSGVRLLLGGGKKVGVRHLLGTALR